MYRNRPLFSLTFLTLGIALSLMLIPNAFAALGVIKLGWDPNVEPSVAGYKVKMGTASGVYGTVIDVGNKTSHNVPDLTVGTTYFFVVVAYNLLGLESSPSSEVFGLPGSGRPNAQAASIAVDEDIPKPFALSGTDPAGHPLTYMILTTPTRGTLSGALPNVTYTPAANLSGVDTFTFKVTNGSLESDPATVTLTVASLNDAPTVTEIGPQSVRLGQSTPEISFTIGDVDDDVSLLNVTAASSDEIVMPLTAITLGGSGASRTIRLSAAPTNPLGSATITVTATDPQNANARSTFTIQVVPNNNPPIVGPISNRSTSEDQSLTIPFTIGDTETPVDSLRVAAHSTDTTLVANSDITFSGTGASRTLTIKPLPDKVGVVNIVLSVTDGQAATVSSTFQLTITPLNDGPVIVNPGPQVVFEDGSISVPITLVDVDSSSSALTLAASSPSVFGIPTLDLLIEGSGAFRNLVITPAANQYGHNAVTLVAGDGLATTTLVVPVRVDAVYDRPVLRPVSDQATPEDTALTIPVSFTSPDAPLSSLRLEAVVSDTELFPPGSIVFSPLLNQATFTPASGRSGVSLVTLQLSDEIGLASSISFGLSVAFINQAPSVSSLADLVAPEGAATAPIPFTVGDKDHPVDSLTISVVPDNSAILPPGSSVLGGSGANRTLTLTPAVVGGGRTRVNVVVDDGIAQTVSSFNLDVTPVNQPPEVSSLTTSLVRVSGPAGGSVRLPDTFLVFDRETALDDLFMLSSSGNGQIVSQVSVAPGVDSFTRTMDLRLGSRSGRTTLSVLVRDEGGLSARFSFDVEVILTSGSTAPNLGRDFRDDGSASILIQSDDGQLAAWFFRGATLDSGDFFQPSPLVDPAWRLFSSGDFDNDGKADLAFSHPDGSCAIWHMDGMSLRPSGAALLNPSAPLGGSFKPVATGDFNSDGKPDVILQNEDDGSIQVAHLNDTTVISTAPLIPDRAADPGWKVVGAADFDSDGKSDLVLSHPDGRVALWYLNGRTLLRGTLLFASPGTRLLPVVTDLNGDGSPDFMEQDVVGQLAVRLMSGESMLTRLPVAVSLPGPNWSIVGPR